MTLITRMSREPAEHPRVIPSASQFMAFMGAATFIAGAWILHLGLGLIALASAMLATAFLIRADHEH